GERAIRVPSERLRVVHHPRPGSVLCLPDPNRRFDPDQAMDSDYEDPVGGHNADYQGRWLAGFAPVGNTELVVIVQQRYDAALNLDLVWGGVAVCLGGVFLAALLWYGVPRVLGLNSGRTA